LTVLKRIASTWSTVSVPTRSIESAVGGPLELSGDSPSVIVSKQLQESPTSWTRRIVAYPLTDSAAAVPLWAPKNQTSINQLVAVSSSRASRVGWVNQTGAGSVQVAQPSNGAPKEDFLGKSVTELQGIALSGGRVLWLVLTATATGSTVRAILEGASGGEERSVGELRVPFPYHFRAVSRQGGEVLLAGFEYRGSSAVTHLIQTRLDCP
jgi:hypothetical protein